MMNTQQLVHRLALDAAKAGLAWLVVLLALEAALPHFVSRFFNLIWLLLFALVASILAFATHHEQSGSSAHESGGGGFVRLFGLASALYAWLALPDNVSQVWRIGSCLAILALALLLPVAFKRPRHE